MWCDESISCGDHSGGHAVQLALVRGCRDLGFFSGIATAELTLGLLLAATRYPRAGVDVGEFMATKLVTAAPGTTLREAARLMLAHRVGGLPVVDGGALVGIITESDIFRRFVEMEGSA